MPLTKATFREDCLKKIRKNQMRNLLFKKSKINSNLQKIVKKIKAKNILTFNSLPFEADIRKTTNLFRKKYNLFVPLMQGESFKMVPFRLPLKKSKFGIYEAGNSLRNIKKIDIAIVPAVGVDGKLQRIGFGKGMYDSFFAKLKKRAYIIFVQPELCHTKEFVCDDYDIDCDLLITPKVIMHNMAKNRK